ncbi:rhomboid family intramembrane serine protease [Microbacterium sp. ANT_H45B]|uniref:rhomboid family intramembrane serine protease n=1 Tax=Microbacterium sp. ANT_H45B TaxID=2597346 RepID=UPI0011EE6738|nr:rhomboid family intramembrane serine protease [Microbacterium sp. ANT_H45B]KAA0961380.1 rhomboid family intramembrane serine protease [Microbacterium sp. ANT_H45B]
MTSTRRLPDLLGSAEFARAYTIAVLTAVFASFTIERAASAVTLGTVIAALCALGAAILWVRREELSLLRIAPSSLLAFLAWAAISLAWSTDKSDTILGWLELVGFAFLAITVGHIRDTLQTVRALGDTLRLLLVVSLGLEILSGVLLDTPFTFLGIQGLLADGGPVQGIFGSRNMLGFVTVIALITFVIEWRSQSLTPRIAVPSIGLAAMLAFFSSSPTVLVLAAAVGVVAVALTIVRHTPTERRTLVQWVLGVLVALALAAAFALRHVIIALLDAGSDFSIRATLWNTILDFAALKPVEGWGWFGSWARGEFPFTYINFLLDDRHQSALNAYFDVLLQLGTAGLLLFLLFGGIATVRSWLVASIRRSVVYAWTPLMLVALAVESMFESFTLVGAGWFMLVLCALRAGQSRSWRENIDAAHTGAIPTLRSER